MDIWRGAEKFSDKPRSDPNRQILILVYLVRYWEVVRFNNLSAPPLILVKIGSCSGYIERQTKHGSCLRLTTHVGYVLSFQVFLERRILYRSSQQRTEDSYRGHVTRRSSKIKQWNNESLDKILSRITMCAFCRAV